MEKAKVLIIGFGGVGIIAGYTLELNGKAEVTALVRSDYDEVEKFGYTIESVDYGLIKGYKPSKIVKNLKEVERTEFDLVLITTKNYPDVFKVEDMISPFVKPKRTVIVLSQNGIGIEEPFMKKFPENIILSCVSMISSNKYVTSVQHVSTDSLKVGFFNNPQISPDSQRHAANTFIDLYLNTKNECIYDENVKFSRWRKLIYNGTFNSVCSLTGVDSGRLQIFGGEDAIIRECMKEMVQIAKSDGVEFPDDIIETMIRADDGIWCTPSMMVDIKKGNYIEAEVIAGNPVRIAQKNGITVPYLTLIYNLLSIIQKRTKENKGMFKIPNERPERGTLYI